MSYKAHLAFTDTACSQISGGFLVTGHASGSRMVWDLGTGESLALPARHEGHVQCLLPVDVLHQVTHSSHYVHFLS